MIQDVKQVLEANQAYYHTLDELVQAARAKSLGDSSPPGRETTLEALKQLAEQLQHLQAYSDRLSLMLLCQGNHIIAGLEIKSTRHISVESSIGLQSFMQDNPDTPAYILGIDQKRRKPAERLTIIDWREFIQELLH